MDNPRSSFLARLDARLNANRSTENSDLGVYARIGGTRYLDESDLDNTRGEAVVDFGYRLERHRFDLAAGVDSQSTLYSEVATTGLVQVNRQRNSWTLDGGWSYRPTERSSVAVDVGYLNVFYDVREYRYRENLPTSSSRPLISAGSFRLTERRALVGRVNYGRYDAQETLTNQMTTLVSFSAGTTRSPSGRRFRPQAGLRRTEQTREFASGADVTESSSGPAYVLRYSRRFERVAA